MTGQRRHRAAVCTVRVEPQPDYVLITMTVNQHLDRHLYSARPDDVRQFGNVRAALEAIIEFLEPFDDDERTESVTMR